MLELQMLVMHPVPELAVLVDDECLHLSQCSPVFVEEAACNEMPAYCSTQVGQQLGGDSIEPSPVMLQM
eukprot:7551925-Prorocentrum_lima.AAC.1